MRSIPVALLLVAVSAAAQTPAGPEFVIGAPSWPPFQNTGHSLTARPGGGFVVAWTTPAVQFGNSVVGARIDAAGTREGFLVDSGGNQLGTAVGAGRGGEFVVVWTRDSNILAQRMSAAGTPLGASFQVNESTTTIEEEPEVGADAAGNFVVVWASSGQDGSGFGVQGQRFTPSGSRLGAEFAVNTYTTGAQVSPRLWVDRSGGFVVVWSSEGQDGSEYGVFGQRFASSGAALGSEFQVNTYTTHSQRAATIAGNGDGFLVSWSHFDGVSSVSHAQRYDASGAARGAEFDLPSATLAGDETGAFTTVRSLGVSLLAQRFEPDGTPRGAEFVVRSPTGFIGGAYIASDTNGNLLVVWQEGPNGLFSTHGQRFGGLLPRELAVDAAATAGSDGNGVLEAGETAQVRPSWRNDNGATQTFDGALALSGPAGPTYTVGDGEAVYGTVPTATTQACSDCYEVTVSGARPATHWDAVGEEAILPEAHGQRKRWALHVGDSFGDVPRASPFYRFVEMLLHHGVTGGCGTGAYCPASAALRREMAVFVLVAKEGAAYAPPACATAPFPDVPMTSGFCPWIAEVQRRGVVAGCGGGNFCPAGTVARQEMSVFALGTLDPAFTPPPCATPPFSDVPTSSPFCPHIAELARRGVIGGCGNGNFCPTAPVARQEMAVFIGGTFGLTLYGL